MKTVLIIGGGPAGLVTAKSLLQLPSSPFKVTVFEAADRVGGIWRARKDERGEKCGPEMRTNLSRFTVGFADLPWTGEGVGWFPEAWQVGRYLEEYAGRFLGRRVVCGRKVLRAEVDKSGGWRVKSKEREGEFEDRFDYLVVASGLYDLPNRVFSKEKTDGVVQHSADFRSMDSFSGVDGGDIVVIGGGISGSEAAATAAFQISNAKYAPGKDKPAWADAKVYHVFDRPFYVLPRYLPRDPYDAMLKRFNQAPDFLPCDMALYELSKRPSDPIVAVNGLVPPERAKKTHEGLRMALGGDQGDLGYAGLVYGETQTGHPSYVGISDTYSEFVRSGLIVPVQGKGVKMVGEDGKTIVSVSQDGTWTSRYPTQMTQPSSIENVRGIIEATGYKSHLEYVSQDIKDLLQHDEHCDRIPFLLSRGSIFSPSIPNIAFTGFYEGPYWGVMEQQARLIAQTWSSTTTTQPDFSVDEADTVRQALKKRQLDVPQFWMADYVGLLDEFAREAGSRRNDSCFEEQKGPAFPARYTVKGSDLNAAEQTVRQVRDLLDDAARFVPAAAFRGMQGTWSLHRKIISRNVLASGGILTGTANFHPREPTAAGFSAEYLYIEQGTFAMDSGYSFPASRRYIYRYSEAKGSITAWFVQEDGESAEKFFHELSFERPASEEKGWIAKGKHWCEPDMYVSSCEFRFRGVALEGLGITYEVKGPNKDYTHESWYRRQEVS